MTVRTTPGDRFDVCVLGSANLDIVASVARLPGPGETLLGTSYAEFPGGKGLNQAVASARTGATTAFVGAVGRDDASVTLRSVLTAEGIHADRLLVTDQPTGRAVILVDDSGENVIVVVPGANALVTTGRGLPASRVLLVQLEIPIDVVTTGCRLARSAGATVVLNPAPASDLRDELLGQVDVLVPNEHEADLMGGVAALLARGVETVIVTRGGEGVEVHHRGERWVEPAFTVDVVDTTGAGDAFCGSLAARLATGAPMRDAVRWACAAGALATTRSGAVPAQPVADAIRALLTSSVSRA